jgi:UDP-N-acetyl-D-glucosamine dehydrogenase
LLSADEISGLGLEPYRSGTVVDAAVLQADHAEYQELRPGDLPGVKVVLDGRGSLTLPGGPECPSGVWVAAAAER